MWPRMLVLMLLVVVLVGGPPTAGAAHEPISRGHAQLLHRAASVGGLAASVERREGLPPRVIGSWAWPVPRPHPLARPYFAPPSPYAAGHRGIDIRARVGTQVLAPADGVVHFAGTVVDRPVLSITHAGGVLSSFEPVATTLVAGDAVSRGQVVGILGAGHCVDGCLHLGARVDGEYVNPLLFLGGVPWSVLLPSA